MSGSRKLFFAGNTLQQAVLAAARHFQIDPDEVEYVPRDRRQGFVKATRRVVIEVNPERPRRISAGNVAAPTPAPRAPVPAAPARPAPPRPAPSQKGPRRGPLPASGPLLDAAAEGTRLLLALAALRLEATVSAGEGRLEVSLAGPDEARVLADGAALLEALEHLLPRVVRGLTGEGVACRVDCGGFHARREVELRELARSAAEEVRRTGLVATLEEMDPAERRIIHLELAGESDLETESLGEGHHKRVTIRPR
jgi:spoIIIJ-associated protein